MYVKVEEKENKNVMDEAKDAASQGGPKCKDANGKDANGKVQSGLLSRRANAPAMGPLSSLEMLHRPPHNLSPNLYTDEEIAKNTDLNKQLGSLSVADVSSRLANFGMTPLVIPPGIDSPTRVYKKSGELVRSSLKNRSQSLPTSPRVGEPPHPPSPSLQRSKSVHFDQRTPVKYFELDESPLDVSTCEGEVQELSFKHKGVGLFQPQQQVEATPPPQPDPPKPLRKSKRFDALARQRQRVLGLYHSNFPVINTRDPKVLQLNVFLSLSRNKKVILRDLALHISGRGACIEGQVLVKNLCYDKRVAARYTWDRWYHSLEVECVYVGSGDRFLPGNHVDLFNFVIEKPPQGQNLQLCMHYVARTDGRRWEFWDNNDGKNYDLDVVTEGFRDPFA